MSQADALRSKIYARINELPTLPHVIPRLLGLIESDRSQASEVAEVISHDPALTSMILKVANSAYYGFSREIASLHRAIPLLGFRMVQSLALSLGILRVFPSTPASRGFSMKALWTHSVAVGTLMRELGRRGANPGQSEHRFIIGLLHDIGKLVFDQFFHQSLAQLLLDASSRPDLPMEELEHERFGLDHGEAGAMLLARWKLPEQIIRPIGAHHRRGDFDLADPQDTAMLRIADGVALEADLGTQGYPSSITQTEQDLFVAGLSPEDREGLRDSLAASREGIYGFVRSVS